MTYNFNRREYHLYLISNKQIRFFDDYGSSYDIWSDFKAHPLELPGINFEAYIGGEIVLDLFWPKGNPVTVKMYNKQWIMT